MGECAEKRFKVTSAGSTLIYDSSLDVMAIRFTGATTAGHQCVIQGSDNEELWRSVAGGANYTELDGVKRKWKNGFKVTTLDSGQVIVEAKRSD